MSKTEREIRAWTGQNFIKDTVRYQEEYWDSALVSHPKVAEAAVIGKPDEVKDEVIVAFVILKTGIEATAGLDKELSKHVRTVLSPVAYPDFLFRVFLLHYCIVATILAAGFLSYS